MSRDIGEKEEEGFPITLVTTRSARWSTQRLEMLAGGSSMVARLWSWSTWTSPLQSWPPTRSPTERQLSGFSDIILQMG